ncbi:MAG: hypothetical protein LBF93_08725 [Zoogloeaceae bacterium]|jgi:hypothetical protein|nr:hypothetical protein [Zoogloeaceae bacterium]
MGSLILTPHALKQRIAGNPFFRFIRDLSKILAAGACWLFLALFIHIGMSTHQDRESRNYLYKLLSALEPLQADIAARLEANAAKASPQLMEEMILEFTRRFPGLSQHHTYRDDRTSGARVIDQLSYRAVLPDGSMTVFSPRAAAFLLLRPVMTDGKIEWSCHASGKNANILPHSCQSPFPASPASLDVTP